VDTKLARSAKPLHLLQLCFYAEQLERIQGRLPEHIHVELGTEERETFRTAEFIAFLRPDQVFASPEALAAQMRKDTEEARAALETIDADDPMRRFPLGLTLARTREAI